MKENNRRKKRARERIRDVRQEHLAIWLKLLGFRGNFERNAADFIAHKLGFTDAYVLSVIRGNRNFGTNTALHMRSMLPQEKAAREFDYRVLTEKVIAQLDITEDEMSQDPPTEVLTEAVPVSHEILANGDGPGLDEHGRPQIAIVLCDGKILLVKLPKGAQIEGTPWVAEGEEGTTGSVNLVFAKTEE